jgi:transposase-like protein
MSKRPRRNRTPEQKAAILKRHHLDKVPVSQLCNENELQPSVFYEWQRQLFERAPTALTSPTGTNREKQLEEKIGALEAKLARKDAVIAEVSEELVALKKELGEP